MVKVTVGVSGKCDDGGVRKPSVGFYRNPDTTCLGKRAHAVESEG